MNCVPTVLALHIEVALDASESDANRSRAHIYIRQGILFLKQREDLPTVRRTLGVLESVLAQKDLLSTNNFGTTSFDRSNQWNDRVPTDSGTEHPTEFSIMSSLEIGGDSDTWFDELQRYDFMDNIGWDIMGM